MTTTAKTNPTRRFVTSSVIAGLIVGLISFGIGVLIIGAIRSAMGLDPVAFGPSVFGGYWFGLAGGLAGVGVWSKWAREWFGLSVNSEATRPSFQKKEIPCGFCNYWSSERPLPYSLQLAAAAP